MFQNIGLNNDFIDITLKAQVTEKKGNWDYIKLKSFYLGDNNVKKQHTK